MKKISGLILLLVMFGCNHPQTISLSPQNPHYFLHNGKTVAIVSSSEHYGAVLNPDFDYMQYLNTLQKEGMPYTRLFAGTYFEKEGSFGIEKNTLAPARGKALLPWKRSDEPGALSGGNKFDLDQWDENYFTRLKSYISEAEKRNIIVEVTLFSSIYGYWDIQVWNPKNNINIKDSLLQSDVQILKNGKILKYQEKFVRKIVGELNQFGNITFEIQNEPWCDHDIILPMDSAYQNRNLSGDDWQNKIELADQSSLDWQKKIASFIVDEENKLGNKHLIAQNYSNHYYSVPDVDPNVSILNFHYAYPHAASQNLKHAKAIAYDESGFAGSDDATYRKEAWRFILAGGGLFNNLDYSFAVSYENGTAVNKAPGGGSTELRKQLRILSDFINSFNLSVMKPDTTIHGDNNSVIHALSDSENEYAVYVEKGNNTELAVQLSAGRFEIEWINTIDGAIVKKEEIDHSGGVRRLAIPEFSEDLAISILKQ